MRGDNSALDSYGRVVDYLRISVTERCNLRCRYCTPEEGMDNIIHQQILTLEQIVRLVKIAAEVGFKRVRLTGGEPLVRKNIAKLIGDIAEIPEIEDISITTNGILFADMAEELKNAGLNRVNISLDTLDNQKFKYITRGGELAATRRAIYKALDLNLQPIKINMVAIKGFNDDEILDFVELAKQFPLHVRFIELMPIGNLAFYKQDKFISIDEIRCKIEQQYELSRSKSVTGSGPAKYYELVGGKGSIGFISPISHNFCYKCNRMRMTANGKLRSCLYHDKEMDLQMTLLNAHSDEQLRRLFIKAIHTKPLQHEMQNSWSSYNRKMCQIGG